MCYSLEDTSLNAWAESEFMGGCLTDEKFSDFEVADSSISRSSIFNMLNDLYIYIYIYMYMNIIYIYIYYLC